MRLGAARRHGWVVPRDPAAIHAPGVVDDRMPALAVANPREDVPGKPLAVGSEDVAGRVRHEPRLAGVTTPPPSPDSPAYSRLRSRVGADDLGQVLLPHSIDDHVVGRLS